MDKITVMWSSDSLQIANDDDDDDNNNYNNRKLWSTFVIVIQKLVGPQFDTTHSAHGNTAHGNIAHPLTIKTDPKYIYIISSYRAVNTLRLG
jgi:hypothetical protein